MEQQVVCPLDGKPCESDCQDRYHDTSDGGCCLTTAQELGGAILDFGGGTVGLLFTPHGGQKR